MRQDKAMRVLLLFALLVSFIAGKTQVLKPGGFMNYLRPTVYPGNLHYIKGGLDKKWSLLSYTGITSGYGFHNRGNFTFFAAPVGLQLNRRINENLYAFAGLSAAPAYMIFNHSFVSQVIQKNFLNNTFYKSNYFDVFTRAELGLMYINDSKTFSVSGSIGVERRNYPLIPYQQQAINPPRPTPTRQY